ncbi:MAG: Peptidase M23 [Candidatus Giovannonibacteria bacterium GW2011_GWA2_53_7]|uniref:Peptidase M23 n=1 Tax=Candidatus Giovannonibacteria bacterium GW2011_GWA2_53_7 TaxID=1618650 RepID=A0A0G1XUV3_9BACT|nr:MAG: Peptidase M23 [Candidatus Giovannonibacteria bacterium GW2011_GWA2_53_7]
MPLTFNYFSPQFKFPPPIPIVLLLLFGLIIVTAGTPEGIAESRYNDELESQINTRNQEISNLEAEISRLNDSLTNTSKQATTLKGEVARLDTTNKKLLADIKLTESRMRQKALVIERLELDLTRQQGDISDLQDGLAEAMRALREASDHSLVEMILAQRNLSDFWVDREHLVRVEAKVYQTIGALRQVHQELKVDKNVAENERHNLLALKAKLADQKKINDGAKHQQNDLLSSTENQEANYRQLIASREAKKTALEQEIANFEAQLKLDVDLSKLPSAGTGPLSWPLDNIFITQNFGRTVDSVRLYASGTHNGVDFRASIGTAIKSVADGVVLGTGDTDLVCPRASYGRWALVKHNNGLTTLYAHLSLIKVNKGQTLARGELVGYSGQTGYATGPHLHLTIYASDGVKIDVLKSKVCSGTYTMPLADPQAYLDPLLYLK